MKKFTIENLENLKGVCERIISITNENIDGNLMAIQLICLGDAIKEFVDNPIVKNSGILVEDENSKLSITNLYWTPRYSSTMEDDKIGRWARVAYAGNDIGFLEGKLCHWQIAWIEKLKVNEETKFKINYFYPSSGKYLFDKLEDAQKEVEDDFNWFINIVKSKDKTSDF